jgi:hypothetical protein
MSGKIQQWHALHKQQVQLEMAETDSDSDGRKVLFCRVAERVLMELVPVQETDSDGRDILLRGNCRCMRGLL